MRAALLATLLLVAVPVAAQTNPNVVPGLSGGPSYGANTFTGTQTAPSFTSTVSTGTAPFTVSSSTVVPNLNSSLLLGSTWASPGAIGGTTPNIGAFTTAGASRYTGATDSSQITLGGTPATYNDLCFTPSTTGNPATLISCGIDANGALRLNGVGAGTVQIGSVSRGIALTVGEDSGSLGSTNGISIHGVGAGSNLVYETTSGPDTNISHRWSCQGASCGFIWNPSGSTNLFTLNQGAAGWADGLAVTGGASGTGATLGDTVSNEPINFSAGTGFLISKSQHIFTTAGNTVAGFAVANQTGTFTPNTPNPYNCGGVTAFVYVCNNADTLDASGGGTPTMIRAYHQVGGTGTKGGRFGVDFGLVLTAATSDTTLSFYQATNFDMEARANMGGSAGNYLGAIFAEGIYARAEAGATYLNEVSGREVNPSIETGASALKLHGDSIVLLSSNAVPAVVEETGYAVGAQGGALPTIDCAFCVGRYDGFNALAASAAIVGYHPSQFTGAGPTITFGDDYRLIGFSNSAVTTNGGDLYGTGAVRVGRTNITDSSTGTTIDPTGSIGSSATVAAGGTGYTGVALNVYDPYGGIWQISTTAGAVTSVTLLRAPHVTGATPANPIALTSNPAQPGTGATINITWSTGSVVKLNGTLQFGTVIGSTCTNSGYITINDSGGTARKVMICS